MQRNRNLGTSPKTRAKERESVKQRNPCTKNQGKYRRTKHFKITRNKTRFKTLKFTQHKCWYCKSRTKTIDSEAHSPVTRFSNEGARRAKKRGCITLRMTS